MRGGKWQPMLMHRPIIVEVLSCRTAPVAWGAEVVRAPPRREGGKPPLPQRLWQLFQVWRTAWGQL